MKSQVWFAAAAAAVGAVASVACSSTSGGGGGTGGATTAGGSGGVGVGGAASGGSGGSSFGGASSGGSSFGGASSGGGSSVGGSSSGGGGNVTLPAGCAAGISIQCNPVTNSPCSSGAACDLGTDQNKQPGLFCFDPPNTQKLGQTCSNGQSGPFCEGTLHCADETDAGGGTCKKFCCANADCGGGTCTPIDSQLGTLGTCS